MFKHIKSKFFVAGLTLSTAASSFAAAAPIDTADVVAALSAGVIAVTAVCTAGLSIVVVVKVFKYVRSAF